jgi:RHS repeat-associated protein
MVIDQTGGLANVKRHDYLPFGEELFAGTAGRTVAQGYSAADGVRQQFTQKERDIETGLDYFGARYFSSNQGRFTGADPAAIKRKHLINPQDLNRYSYVANNPLAFIDPDGEEKIKVIVRTFIPQTTVSMPHPNGGVRTFEGDNRDIGKPGTYRTQQIITVETDPRRNNGSPIYGKPERDTGVTIERGWIWDSTKKASGNTLEAAVKRDNDVVSIQAKGNESNPLVMGSPGITYDFMIGVQSEGPKGNVTVTVNGQHDGFPAYEILIVRPETGDNTERVVYGHDPRTTGQTALSLAGGGEFEAKKKCVQKPGGECQ